MSIVFIGTPAFAVPSLERLAGTGHDIAAVITQPDRPAGRRQLPRPPPAKLAAQTLGLRVLQPPTLRDAEVLEGLRALSPEAIIVVAYGQILRQDVLEIPVRGVLNVHPSLLPRWRGASPIPASILAGDERTGVTIMLMDTGMDSGPILAQEDVPIHDEDTSRSLSDTLADLGADLLVRTLPSWLADEIPPQPQDDSLATTCPLLRKEDGAIDWQLPATEIWRRVRAYDAWPGAYTSFDGGIIHIWKAWPVTVELAAEPGVVLELRTSWRGELPADIRREAALAVQTGSGLLVPLELQRAGRRVLAAADFLRGMHGLIGRRLRP